jgi:hypothetical protein
LTIESSCKICPKELVEIKEFLNRIIAHPDDFIVVIYFDALISGVACFLNEPTEHYLECLGGFFDDESDFVMTLNYLRNNYKSYKMI